MDDSYSLIRWMSAVAYDINNGKYELFAVAATKVLFLFLNRFRNQSLDKKVNVLYE